MTPQVCKASAIASDVNVEPRYKAVIATVVKNLSQMDVVKAALVSACSIGCDTTKCAKQLLSHVLSKLCLITKLLLQLLSRFSVNWLWSQQQWLVHAALVVIPQSAQCIYYRK